MNLLTEMFDKFEKSACRIETLQQYKIVGNEWERYLSYTQGVPMKQYNAIGWADMLYSHKEHGKRVERIRVVPQKLNSYLVFEFEACYVQNIVAGENITVINYSEYEKLINSDTQGDYWIFDEKYLLFMEYTSEGEFIKSKLIDDDKIVTQCVQLYNKLLKHSYPVNQVLSKIRNQQVEIF